MGAAETLAAVWATAASGPDRRRVRAMRDGSCCPRGPQKPGRWHQAVDRRPLVGTC